MAHIHRCYFNSSPGLNIFCATQDVKRALRDSGVREGLVTVLTTGGGGGVALLENDPAIHKGLAALVMSLVPNGENQAGSQSGPPRRSGSGPLAAHLRAALVGRSLTIPVVDGKLGCDVWQEVVVFSFDNVPGRREVMVQVIDGAKAAT